MCIFKHFCVDFVKFINSLVLVNTLFSSSTKTLNAQQQDNITTTNHETIFTYNQLNLIVKKTAYHDLEDYKFFKKLVTLNTKNGYKLKALHVYSGALQYIYNYFNLFDSNLSNDYASYKNFFEFSQNFSYEFYKPDFFIRYIHSQLEIIFLLKKVKLKKKKKASIPKVLISYIPSRARASITLRLINSYINNSSITNNTIRVGNALLYLALSGRNSFLYKKKLTMYNKLLEKKKFY